jgi:GNAT superfamily N-acetyltransferase
VEIRRALLVDVPELTGLIERSARVLSRSFYPAEQVEAALGSAWGVDTQLIEDGTYFVAALEGTLAGCGGWSPRKTLFGADRSSGRSPELLNPRFEAARIRAFFVDAAFARRGVGRALLERCEEEIRKAGFSKAQLVATLPGVPFYGAFGYLEQERIEHELPGGLRIAFVSMAKSFALAG